MSITREPRVPRWLWLGNLSLMIAVLAVGLGLAVALALGWRSLSPHRTPDWTVADLVWTRHGAGTSEVSGDGYHMLLTQPHQQAWAVGEPFIADFDLALQVRSLMGSEDVGCGLLYRYQDAANHYVFAIGGDGTYSIGIVKQGELIPLREWQPWPHVHRGAAANRLRVRCQGTLCRFYVNDEFTAEIVDDTFLAGHTGLWAESFSDEGLEVIFEEVQVWVLGSSRTQGARPGALRWWDDQIRHSPAISRASGATVTVCTWPSCRTLTRTSVSFLPSLYEATRLEICST